MEDDGDDKDDSKRRTRNMSEKKRRDQFNLLVNELSTMVSASNRKMDKSTVLKSTISFLKNHNEITVRSRVHDIREEWKPAFLSNEEFTYLVLEALEGFIMVFSATGQIHYVSESITSLLGHNVADLANKSIFDLILKDDQPSLFNILQGPRTAIDSVQSISQDNQIRFQCHLRRGTFDFDRDETSYELIEFNGHFRTNTEEANLEDLNYQSNPDSRFLFVCTGRLYTPQLIRDVSLADSNRSEFTSRHSLEWKFLFLDHRAPPIIGYLPFEVLGTSGYDYYHFDDLEKVVTCHEALMQKGELTSCYYRFLTKGQQWIWLQTRFYITYHQWNSKPEFVVCTHRVVNYADVAKSGKQESVEADLSQEGTQAMPIMKEPPVENAIAVMSPTYMSEASDAFSTSYQAMSQATSVKSGSVVSAAGTIGTTSTRGTAPPTPAGVAWPRSCARYTANSDTASHRFAPGSDTASVRYAPESDSASVRFTLGSDTASHRDAHGSDSASHRYAHGSDTNSMSDESRTSRNNNSRENRTVRIHGLNGVSHGTLMTIQQLKNDPRLVPQRTIGAQYLETGAYVNAGGAMGAVGPMSALGTMGAVSPMGAMGAPAVQGMLPLSIPTLPIIVTTDQAQVQEQLQQKHEKLQQMIVRQQEELLFVKEQLLLARLGILPPLPNVPNSYLTEEIQNIPRLQAEIAYEEQTGRQHSAYLPQPSPPHPHMPQ